MKAKLLKKLRKYAKEDICIQFNYTTKCYEVCKFVPSYHGTVKEAVFKTKSEDEALLKLEEHRRRYILKNLSGYSRFHTRVNKINERLAEL